jgi:YVTN family beta-propeller protein
MPAGAYLYDAQANTVYCANDTSISVIDCAANRVIASISHLFYKVRALTCNP